MSSVLRTPGKQLIPRPVPPPLHPLPFTLPALPPSPPCLCCPCLCASTSPPFVFASPSAPPLPRINPPSSLPHIAFTPVVAASAHKTSTVVPSHRSSHQGSSLSDAEVGTVTSRLLADVGFIMPLLTSALSKNRWLMPICGNSAKSWSSLCVGLHGHQHWAPCKAMLRRIRNPFNRFSQQSSVIMKLSSARLSCTQTWLPTSILKIGLSLLQWLFMMQHHAS